MSETEPYIVCSVLNWNNYEDTRECIESLLGVTYPNLEVLLVDNGSMDDSGRRLAKEFPEISTLFLDENLGFGPGHNRGVRWATERSADYVMMVNNDVTFSTDQLFEGLVETMEADPDIGILTPQVYTGLEGRECHFRRGVIRHETATPDYEYPPVEAGSDLIDNDYVPFIAALIRPAVFERVGLYPEEYFMYYGDLDYCTRITRAGFAIKTYLPGRVYHGVSNTSGGSIAPIRSYYNMRNRFIFARNFPTLVDSASFYPHILRYLCYQTARRVYHAEFAGLVALLRGAFDGLAGKTGKGPYP
ncbi:glycosyltransferase family 2 protein [Salinibaculum rarum]|uniref:glycosyltransferase family 2 protein n=1 Tax=Salinibaculum rarum TaxID=3058903 RepID=UPI00265FEAF5|nr:glycosyltransferase family 2 protein [Salinibaculum sp. KK48]